MEKKLYMTWKEFKDAVDQKLKEGGFDENTEIWYIDVSFLSKDDFETGRVEVNVDDLFGISIG